PNATSAGMAGVVTSMGLVALRLVIDVSLMVVVSWFDLPSGGRVGPTARDHFLASLGQAQRFRQPLTPQQSPHAGRQALLPSKQSGPPRLGTLPHWHDPLPRR